MSYKTTLIALYESKGVNCYKTSVLEYWEIGGMQALSGKRFYRETDWRTYSMVKKEKKKTLLYVSGASGSHLCKNDIVNIRIFPVYEISPVRWIMFILLLSFKNTYGGLRVMWASWKSGGLENTHLSAKWFYTETKQKEIDLTGPHLIFHRKCWHGYNTFGIINQSRP